MTLLFLCCYGILETLTLEEEILHKERRDFVRRQNRGVRKICRGKKTKVSRPLYFHILAKGGDVMYGRIVDIMLELAEA